MKRRLFMIAPLFLVMPLAGCNTTNQTSGQTCPTSCDCQCNSQKEKHKVKFSYDGEIVLEQEVEHGELATNPMMKKKGSEEPYPVGWLYHYECVAYNESDPAHPLSYYEIEWLFDMYPVLKDFTLYANLYE